MKLHKEFNQYLADLAVITFKLHNLHWNVKGIEFMAIHQFTESVYDQTFDFFDAIAEHQKMYGVMPDCKLSDYLANAEIKEVDAKAFTAKEVLQIVKNDLTVLRNKATALYHAADEEKWFSAATLFDEHVQYYNKQLWFIESSL
ncbi:Dps family protein [Treponema pedis]|uniref:Neutrophil-activating protein A n=2 Tax=Treponema pedis TaxID=409322 RepID=S5ZTE7_9SPIR|nr:DNA starvation/stationary phase protection protein [Treponema pedis]AGT43420.1 neutrophil-activating protein A [Treponema pedis str. T A4]QOW60961.1 DNA starvation/stationary phase protection protein [Treponema pedis]QSI04232.1 DNA starvation/stationary phase protection protein [Treponema pedis]